VIAGIYPGGTCIAMGVTAGELMTGLQGPVKVLLDKG
jgi:hypothetical protein